ncbi:MAG: hypothetical protein CVU39_07125 [Chloroflexi bacterium HGW-Chloroflexi-10]|nr:MAG: hypothetical protein CVU39_07125 [Chloroflexi bacterium HGW-Chloroflexi-10]
METLKTKQKIGLIIGSILFVAGLVLGFFFNIRLVWSFIEGMSFWGYPEVIDFDPSLPKEGMITQIKCPLLITPYESKEIRFRIKNPKEYEIKPLLEILDSNPGMEGNITRSYEEFVIEPGETIETSYAFSSRNITPNSVFFVRALLHQTGYYPASTTKHCGVLVYQVGRLPGIAIISLVIGIFLALLLSGIWIWWKNSTAYMRRSNRILNGMISLSVFLVANMVTIVLGWKIPAIILLVVTILAFFAILQHILTGSGLNSEM